MKSFRTFVKEMTELPIGKVTILKAVDKKYERGLRIRNNTDRSYNIQYWAKDPDNVLPIEVEIDGKSVKKDARNIKLLFHPKNEIENEQ